MYLEKYNLEGKTVVINGGARNIGFACAEAFSECGATVALTDINPIVKDSAEALKKYGKSCSGHIVDLTDSEQVDETAKEIITIHKNIDIVVNNAGIARCTPAEEISDTEWLEVMDINVNSMYWCCRSFGKIMLKRTGGSIVNVGSMSGIISNKPQQQVHYNASKAAVHMATKSLAGEWATKGIRVNAVAPTYIDTDMTPISTTNKEWLKIWLDMTPMKRVGECDEIASAVLFLGSKASSLITGSILVVDAGYTIW